jgi:hypothetical protein
MRDLETIAWRFSSGNRSFSLGTLLPATRPKRLIGFDVFPLANKRKCEPNYQSR